MFDLVASNSSHHPCCRTNAQAMWTLRHVWPYGVERHAPARRLLCLHSSFANSRPLTPGQFFTRASRRDSTEPSLGTRSQGGQQHWCVLASTMAAAPCAEDCPDTSDQHQGSPHGTDRKAGHPPRPTPKPGLFKPGKRGGAAVFCQVRAVPQAQPSSRSLDEIRPTLHLTLARNEIGLSCSLCAHSCIVRSLAIPAFSRFAHPRPWTPRHRYSKAPTVQSAQPTRACASFCSRLPQISDRELTIATAPCGLCRNSSYQVSFADRTHRKGSHF